MTVLRDNFNKSVSSALIIALLVASALVVGSVTTTGNITSGGNVRIGGASGPTLTVGSGVPASTQPRGSLYLRTDTAKLYQNTDGATSWLAVGVQASQWAFLFGNGEDGNITFDGSSTVVLPDGTSIVPSGGVYTLPRDIEPANLTNNSGSFVKVNGFRIIGQVTSTCTNNQAGGINANGQTGGNGSGTTGGTAGVAAAAGSVGGGTAGGAGGNASGAGGTGTNQTGSFGTPVLTSTNSTANQGAGGSPGTSGSVGPVTYRGGGGGASTLSGGNGGNTSVSVAAAGAPDLMALYRGTIPNSTTNKWQFGTGGGGGGAAASSAGGAGGGGGGEVMYTCGTMAGSGTVTATGGNGGNGSGANAGGGGGGGGGLVELVYFTRTGNAMSAAGGTHGAGASPGTNGGDGATGITRAINLSGDGT